MWFRTLAFGNLIIGQKMKLLYQIPTREAAAIIKFGFVMVIMWQRNVFSVQKTYFGMIGKCLCND